VTLLGAAWFGIVEGFGIVDGLYQSVMTVSTVGFGEVRPFGTRARIFAIALMLVGVGIAFYTLTSLIQELVEGPFGRWGRWRMDRRIQSARDHAIVCGFGRVGQTVARLVGGRQLVVAVDVDDERGRAATELGILAIVGDTTDDDVLRRAGVERASVLVVTVHSDGDAISTVLSARALNSDLRIVARANAESSVGKLRRAGADQVVNPLDIGAQRLVTFALQPSVADFLDVVTGDHTTAYRLEELAIPEGSVLDGVEFGEARIRERTGAMVLAVRTGDSQWTSNPGADTRLRAGSIVIAIGTAEELVALDRLLVERLPSAR
jgi:voltage-gated potassium channel